MSGGDREMRERSDSVSAFKTDKMLGGFNEFSKPFASPGLSPGFMS